MSDAIESRQNTPFPAEAVPQVVQADALAGDWSEGLRGAARALGIPDPRLLQIEHIPPPPPRPIPAPAPVAEMVEAPDAWAAASEDPLQSQPPPPAPMPEATPPSAAPAFLPDITPTSPAPAFLPDAAPPSPASAVEAEKTPPYATRAPEPAFEAGKTPPLATRMPETFRPDAPPAAPEAPPPPAIVPPPPPPAAELRAEDAADGAVAEKPSRDVPGPDGGGSRQEPSWTALPNVVSASPGGEPSTPWSEAVAAPPAPAESWGPTPVAVTPAVAQESPWGGVSASAETVISRVPHEAPPVWGAPPAPAPAAAAGWAMPPPVAPAAPAAADQWSTPPAPAAAADEWSTPPAPAAAADEWSTPPAPAAAAEEWKPEETADEWQQIKKTQAPELGAAKAANWGSLSKGPDWAAPPPSDAAPAADDAWGAAPPPPAESAWGAAPAAAAPGADDWAAPPPVAAAAPAPQPEWGAPPAAESEWSPPAPAPASRSSWNAPPAGASALEQLDSESIEAAPEGAKDLFGSVPAGASLAGDDEEAPAEEPPLEELPPETIEEKPVELSDDDADLLVPVDDEVAAPPPPPAQPLAQMAPVSQNPLEVRGEHRVAVHTRGGRTVRGTVRDVDLGKAHFALAPQGGGEAAPVYHSDVKAIFFMLAAGEKPKQGDGRKVRVTFNDGRSIDGHRDGGEGKHGFFIVPLDAHRTNLRRIYVAREATLHVKDI